MHVFVDSNCDVAAVCVSRTRVVVTSPARPAGRGTHTAPFHPLFSLLSHLIKSSSHVITYQTACLTILPPSYPFLSFVSPSGRPPVTRTATRTVTGTRTVEEGTGTIVGGGTGTMGGAIAPTGGGGPGRAAAAGTQRH
jgi:hypothetical protein